MSIKRTIISTILALALVAVVAPVATQATTVSDLMAEISALSAQLQALQGSTSTTTTSGNIPAACAGVTFTRNLTVGATGSDVKCLQALLNLSASTQVATTGAGSKGYETSTFGPKTLVAVKAYQTANGLTPANQVGPMTRAKLNAQLGGSSSTTTTTTTTTGTTTGSVAVSLASDNPASAAIVGGQAQAALLSVNFSGTGTVTSITLNRSGISDSNLFTAVYLYEGNTRITSGYSFNSNSTLTMNGLSIAVNGTQEISVRGDLESSTSLESSATITLVGFTANGATTSANVMGNAMTVVNGSLATAYLPNWVSGTDSPADTTIASGSVNQTLWSQNISVSPRAVMLSGLTVKMIGSAPTNAVANIGLYVDSNKVASATINSMNQFVFDASVSPITLATGTHLLEVRGDVVAGSSRSFYLTLEQGSDIVLKDSQLGVYIAAAKDSTHSASNVNGSYVTINNATTGGSVTVNQNPAFNNITTLVGGATNVTMGSWTFTAYGEDEKVTELKYMPTIASSIGGTYPRYLNVSTPTTITTPTLANVGLYVNGGQVGSNQTVTSGTPVTFSNLGSNLVVPAGTTVTVSIKGDVITGPSATPTSTNYYDGTVVFNPASDSNNTQGQSSSLFGTVPTAAGGQTLTISSSNVSFAGTTGFAATAAAPNNTGVKIGSFTIQTGSAEGINLNNVAVTFPSASTMIAANDITNLRASINGTAIGTPIGQPVAGANNFSATVPVSASSSAEVDVYGDIGSLTSCGGSCTITPVATISYRGVISGTANTSTATPAVTTTAGVSAIDANTGVTTVSSSSLAAQLVSGNSSSALPIVTFNVVATSALGGATIQNMTFSTVSNTIQSVTVNGQTANITGNTGTIYNVGIKVPSTYSGVNIPVTVKLVGVGSGQAGTSGAPVQLILASITYNNGSTVVGPMTLTNTPESAQLNLVASVPTVALTGSATSGLYVGTQKIGTFTITAGTGDIQVKQIPVTISTNGGASVTGGTVVLKDASGNTLTGAPAAINGGVNQDFIFSGTGRTISSGTSETYTVYAAVTGTLGTSGQSSVVFQLGDKAGFEWYDVAGNSSLLGGSGIYNYSTDSQSKSN